MVKVRMSKVPDEKEWVQHFRIAYDYSIYYRWKMGNLAFTKINTMNINIDLLRHVIWHKKLNKNIVLNNRIANRFINGLNLIKRFGWNLHLKWMPPSCKRPAFQPHHNPVHTTWFQQSPIYHYEYTISLIHYRPKTNRFERRKFIFFHIFPNQFLFWSQQTNTDYYLHCSYHMSTVCWLWFYLTHWTCINARISADRTKHSRIKFRRIRWSKLFQTRFICYYIDRRQAQVKCRITRYTFTAIAEYVAGCCFLQIKR